MSSNLFVFAQVSPDSHRCIYQQWDWKNPWYFGISDMLNSFWILSISANCFFYQWNANLIHTLFSWFNCLTQAHLSFSLSLVMWSLNLIQMNELHSYLLPKVLYVLCSVIILLLTGDEEKWYESLSPQTNSKNLINKKNSLSFIRLEGQSCLNPRGALLKKRTNKYSEVLYTNTE